MDYSALKHSHAGLAYLTIMLFVIRFLLFSVSPKWRTNKVFKIVPHVIDTLLLVFALMMVFSSTFTLGHGWLAAKVIGLFVYIGFGVVAIRKANKAAFAGRSEEHTSELQSRPHLVCRLLLEKKKDGVMLDDLDVRGLIWL